MAEQYLLAIDQGTTSSRAILFSSAGDIIQTAQKELTLHYPQKGWVEQDANEIWDDTLGCIYEVLATHEARDIAAIGITNQRETTVIWDKKTGEPIYNAIVWQDRRAHALCDELKAAGHEESVTAKTGLLLDPYFSATKIKWVLDNVEGARARAEAGELAFGTIDSFLLWRLTGGAGNEGSVHKTDATNAARTMLYDIKRGRWDEDLLALFDIPRVMLPSVHDNVHDFGVSAAGLFDAPIKIGGMAGDQHAAVIGQACFDKGMVKSTYGTGCFALMNIGAEFKASQNRLLTTIAYQFDGKPVYAIEGAIFVAGAAVQWLRDNLGLIENSSETEAIAQSVDDTNEVYFVPAFTGLGAPYWEPNAKAAIMGLSRESNKAHIIRAALEAQGYQTLDLMDAFKGDSGAAIEALRIDGGLAANEFVCQFLADMLGVRVDVPKITETTALGAAYLAGLSAGIYGGLEDITTNWQRIRSYEPNVSAEKRAALYAGWQAAVKKVLA